MGEKLETGVGARRIASPSRWYYALGAGVIIAAIVVVVVFMLRTIVPDIQLLVPGSHELELEEPGTYTVFYEYQSVLGGKVYATGELSGMLVGLRSQDGQAIALPRPSGIASYAVGGRAGESVLEFEIDRPGTYLLEAEYSSGSNEPEVVLALGQGSVVSTILISLGILFGGLIAGGFLIGRTYVRRRRARRIEP